MLHNSDGRDWPGYGRTFGQQHYSPLAQINKDNIHELGLAWSLDLEGLQNSATQPIAINGVLYFATGLSIVQAVDAASGKRLWRYDPRAAERAGLNLRLGWGVRGISWWNGKIYTGTQDGRLIAIDAKSGKPVWSVQTFDANYPAHINGAPRVFNGRVIIGYASTTGATRGYVTAYDAETGKELWRSYTVPGNPSDGFENETMKMAARSWAGQWWKFGGGADVWNHAPDLRRSAVSLITDTFSSIVREGTLVPGGMPKFAELNDTQLSNLRQYIRTEAHKLRDKE